MSVASYEVRSPPGFVMMPSYAVRSPPAFVMMPSYAVRSPPGFVIMEAGLAGNSPLCRPPDPARTAFSPGLLLVLSLLAFEEIFGFVGLFLSFPALYIATRIHRAWAREDDASAAG